MKNMKHNTISRVFTSVIIFFTTSSFSQDLKILGKSFVITSNYNAVTCDAIGENVGKSEILMRGYIFNVVSYSATHYVVKLPPFKDKTINSRFVENDAGSDIYFLIPFEDFLKICQEAISKHSFTIGIPTIPAKLRFGNNGKGVDSRYFRFEGNVNLGLSGGYKYSFGRESQYAMNGVIGFTTSSVPVDSASTKGKVNSSTSAASFSPHVALVFEIRDFQFGLYSGIDFLNGEPNKFWVYRNKLWLGVGIGYNLFKIGGAEKQSD